LRHVTFSRTQSKAAGTGNCDQIFKPFGIHSRADLVICMKRS